jgi:8-oxo-dGTP diphosphatase
MTSTRSSPIAGVSVLVIHEARVLLVKRGREPGRGFWALPGGRVEAGESAEAAAVREVAEETGIVVGGLRRIDSVKVAPQGVSGVADYAITVFSAGYVAGQASAGDDAAEVRWVGLAETADLRLTEGTRTIIDKHGKTAHAA